MGNKGQSWTRLCGLKKQTNAGGKVNIILEQVNSA